MGFPSPPARPMRAALTYLFLFPFVLWRNNLENIPHLLLAFERRNHGRSVSRRHHRSFSRFPWSLSPFSNGGSPRSCFLISLAAGKALLRCWSVVAALTSDGLCLIVPDFIAPDLSCLVVNDVLGGSGSLSFESFHWVHGGVKASFLGFPTA